MNIQAHPTNFYGNIIVPGSKSHTIRALILATLAEGTSHISNPLPSNDCLSTVKAIRQIGADADIGIEGKNADSSQFSNVWTIHGAGKNLHLPENQIDVGNSGSLMYFLCPVLATLHGWCTFTGDESICTRPVNHLVDALNQVGAQANSINQNSDTPPFKFCGPFDVNKTLTTDGKLSQYISGFMMAATLQNGTFHINLTDPKETPYLTMTQKWLESVGVNCQVSSDYKQISVKGPVQIKAFDRAVPSDWEAVAFPLIAALITNSKIVIDNVDGSGSQGDAEIVDVLQSVGAQIEWNKDEQTLTVCGGKRLSAENLKDNTLNITISPFPDAICALSVIACFIEGTTVISDVEICRKKETDRIKAMVSELSKLGADIKEGEDCLIIHGHSPLTVQNKPNPQFNIHGGTVESYKDHRIAMSLACLASGLKDGQSVIINDAECCSVSFPRFFETMANIGGKYTTIN